MEPGITMSSRVKSPGAPPVPFVSSNNLAQYSGPINWPNKLARYDDCPRLAHFTQAHFTPDHFKLAGCAATDSATKIRSLARVQISLCIAGRGGPSSSTTLRPC